MKKYFAILFSFILVFALMTPISAQVSYPDELIISDYDELETVLYNEELNVGDRIITNQAYQDAVKYEDELNNSISYARTDEPIYSLVSIKVVEPYDVIKTGHLREVAVGMTASESSTANISISNKYKDWTISAGISKSTSYSYTGPSEGYIGSGARISHRLYVQVLYGTLQEATYEVRSKYTNEYIRTEKHMQLTNVDHLIYSSNASISPDGMYYMSLNSNGIAGVSNFNKYKSLVEGNGKNYLFFSGMQWFE